MVVITPKALRCGIAGSELGSGVVRRPFDRLIADPVSRNSQQSLLLHAGALIAYAADRTSRKETEPFKVFCFDELSKRDKANLDIFWLKDESLEESANLPPPDVIATEIAEDLAAALDQFAEIAASISPNSFWLPSAVAHMLNPKEYFASFRRFRDEFARETAAARSAMAAAIESSQRLWRGVEAANARWLKDSETVVQSLPQRGWYLTGREPCTLVHHLARFIGSQDWEMVDRTILDNMPRLLPEKAAQWLSEQDVPAYCVKRFQLFLDHHHEGRYEEATFIGIPLLDELSRYLYEGADFTTKRQSKNCTKPAMAMRRASGLGVTSFASRFVSSFGSLQKDSTLDRCADPDYWCRHAILHGQMQRPMGLKDSAKCYMAIAFLIFARDESVLVEADSAADVDESAVSP